MRCTVAGHGGISVGACHCVTPGPALVPAGPGSASDRYSSTPTSQNRTRPPFSGAPRIVTKTRNAAKWRRFVFGGATRVRSSSRRSLAVLSIISGYTPRDRRFSLPLKWYLNRHHLPPRWDTSRYSPFSSNKRIVFAPGLALFTVSPDPPASQNNRIDIMQCCKQTNYPCARRPQRLVLAAQPECAQCHRPLF